MLVRHARLVFLSFVVTLVTSCATDEPALTADQAAADKTWFVGSYDVGGQGAAPGKDATAVVAINPALMSIEGAAGCGTFSGSFTLGTEANPAFAGFTIPGRAPSDCDAAIRSANDLVIEALEGTTAFSYDGDNLVLTGPQSSVELLPAD